MFDSQLLEEIEHWVTDLGYSRTKETKYFKIVEIYWMVKAKIAQSMEKKRRNSKTSFIPSRFSKGNLKLCAQRFLALEYQPHKPEKKMEI